MTAHESKVAAPVGGVDVLAVIESRRDRDGVLDDEGRALESSYRYALQCRGVHCEAEIWEAVRYQARNLKAAADSLRNAGRVPLTLLGRAPRRYLARATGAAS